MPVVLEADVKWIPFGFQIGDDSAIKKVGLVTREEFEEQRKELVQLREKIEALEELVDGEAL